MCFKGVILKCMAVSCGTPRRLKPLAVSVGQTAGNTNISVLAKDKQKSLKCIPVTTKLILQLKEHAESFIFFGS